MTSTFTVTWVGVILSFIAVFALNMTYFSAKGLYPAWLRALGRTMEQARAEGEGQNMAIPFVLTFLGLFAQAFAMDWIIQASAALYGHDVSFIGGLLGGATIGLAVAAGASLGHRVFSGQGLKVWVIECGADVLGLAIMGAIFSFWH